MDSRRLAAETLDQKLLNAKLELNSPIVGSAIVIGGTELPFYTAHSSPLFFTTTQPAKLNEFIDTSTPPKSGYHQIGDADNKQRCIVS